MDFTWKIGGEAGFGIMTTGLVFSKIATRYGYNIFDYIKYPSLIRGGHNSYEVRVSSKLIFQLKLNVEVLICLNKETLDKNTKFLADESIVIYDEEDFEIVDMNFIKVSVPFEEIIAKLKGQSIMKNTIALGASLAILGADLEELFKIFDEQFKKKGQEVIDFNKKFAQEGFDHVQKNYKKNIKSCLTKKPFDSFDKAQDKSTQGKLVLTGNDAFSLGAVIADCRFYVAYPMTPSSSVLTNLALWQDKVGMVVRHAEDEISVINTAIGSSFAGVRSSVGTSGGGFALMVETISLAGITETPLVIFLAQRPGPATGMPTWTEQGDLLFAVNSGHGEFPKIVLAPGDVEEMLELTLESFNLADIYQTPVIVMSDMLLSEAHQSVEKKFFDSLVVNYKVERGKIKDSSFAKASADKQKYLRYQITDDGISPRLLPGTPGYFYQANSYEHLEDGHTTEDDKERVKQVDKRARKMTGFLANHFKTPKIYGDIDQAEIVFVAWGSSKGSILEAQKILESQGKKTAMIHFTYLYPMDKEKVGKIFENNKRYILVENNSEGQFGKLLAAETGVIIEEKILKYSGRPIWSEEIVNKTVKY